MKEVDSVEELMREIRKNPGIGLVPTPDGGLKIAISIDPARPHLAFDVVNSFETALMRIAGSNLEKVKLYSQTSDDIRRIVIKQLEDHNIDPKSLTNYPKHLEQ